MGTDGLDDVFKYSRFNPSDTDAVTYYLPRLIAGSTLHGADKLISHADIYSCEPKDLAYLYAPAPQAESSGDRFFFTTCKRKSGSSARSARVAGAGTWTVNKTKNVYHAGAKVGEVKSLSFRKGGACTGWVMEEYRCLLPDAVVADGVKVLCKIHLSPSACAAAREESAAYKHRQEREEPPVPEPDTVTVTASAHVQKRPAPAVADTDLSSAKKMRMADPVPAIEEEYQDCPVWFGAPVAPVSSLAACSAAAEAEDNTDRLSCSWEEIFGVQEEENKEQGENNIEQFLPPLAEPVSGWEPEDLEEMERFLADGDDEEEERQAKEAEEFMAGLENRCNAVAADLHSRSTDGRNQFFSFATVH